MPDVEALFRRLAARGYFEVSPADITFETGTSTDDEGRTWTEYDTRPGVAVVWAPKGQGGPSGGRHRFNPFCTRSVVRPTLVEALAEMVEATAPPYHTIDDLAWERERLRPCTCKRHGWYPRGDDGLDCPVHPHPKRVEA